MSHRENIVRRRVRVRQPQQRPRRGSRISWQTPLFLVGVLITVIAGVMIANAMSPSTAEVQAWRTVALRSTAPEEERIRAIEKLTSSGAARGDICAALLRSESERIRCAAVQALPEEVASMTSLRVSMDDQSAEVRVATVIRAGVIFGGGDVIRTIATKPDPSPKVEICAAEACLRRGLIEKRTLLLPLVDYGKGKPDIGKEAFDVRDLARRELGLPREAPPKN